MSDPYAPPEADVRPHRQQSSIRAFSKAMGSAWNRSHGARLALAGRSLAFWIPTAISLSLIIALTSGPDLSDDDLFAAVGLLLVLVIVAPFFARLAAFSMVAKQIEVSWPGRGNRWRVSTALKTAPFLIVPAAAAMLIAATGGFVLEWLSVPEDGPWDVLVLAVAPIPFAVTLPLLWAANPFWVDQDAGAVDGLKQGWEFLKQHRGGAAKNLGQIGILFVGSVFFSPVWLLFDVLSKTSFLEAYRRAQVESEVPDEPSDDSDSAVLSYEELRRLREEPGDL